MSTLSEDVKDSVGLLLQEAHARTRRVARLSSPL
jgi:hypothetical protein